jgi:transposase
MPEIQISKALQGKNDLIMTATGSGLSNCPDCGTPSSSEKGKYIRQLQDLPVQRIAVRLEVRMRRWRCRNQRASRGAPQAQQVADRFHLLQNLRETIERQLSRNHGHANVSPPAEIGLIGGEAAAGIHSHGRQPEVAKHH